MNPHDQRKGQVLGKHLAGPHHDPVRIHQEGISARRNLDVGTGRHPRHGLTLHHRDINPVGQGPAHLRPLHLRQQVKTRTDLCEIHRKNVPPLPQTDRLQHLGSGQHPIGREANIGNRVLWVFPYESLDGPPPADSHDADQRHRQDSFEANPHPPPQHHSLLSIRTRTDFQETLRTPRTAPLDAPVWIGVREETHETNVLASERVTTRSQSPA